jgi:NADPH2:quinone reductase
MKAIQVQAFGGPEALRLAEVPDLVPGPGQVLVRVGAAGVNPVDTYIRAGAHAQKPTLPYTPGEDGAGTVVALGPGATGFSPGDRVYLTGSLTGTYAEQALCLRGHLHPLPGGITFSQGAGLGIPYFTAHRALFQMARVAAGQTLLIHGASGGVGIAALQLARAAGLTVIGTAGTEAGRALVAGEGAHFVLDHHDEGEGRRLMELTGHRGADVILEMLANRNLARDLTLVAKGGHILVVGSRGPIEIDPRALMLREASISGVFYYNATPEEKAATFSAIGLGLEAGHLRPVVGAELPLAEAARAHEDILRAGSHGKIVLIP